MNDDRKEEFLRGCFQACVTLYVLALMAMFFLIALSGCARDKMTVRVDYKPITQEATVSVQWEVSK